MDQWQPIATAPKDRPILAWDPYEGEVAIVYWDGKVWLWPGGEYRVKVTHWMPLPEPPSEQG